MQERRWKFERLKDVLELPNQVQFPASTDDGPVPSFY